MKFTFCTCIQCRSDTSFCADCFHVLEAQKKAGRTGLWINEGGSAFCPDCLNLVALAGTDITYLGTQRNQE